MKELLSQTKPTPLGGGNGFSTLFREGMREANH